MSNLPAQPFDFTTAVAASREAAESQHNAEKWYAQKCREWAEAERAYRLEFGKKITEIRAEGVPATLALDAARSNERVAELRFQRDLAEGLKDAASQSVWRHTANRKDLQEFLDWSKRASFLDAGEPNLGRRAA